MAFDQDRELILRSRNELDRVDAETVTVMLSRTALYPLPNGSACTLIFFCSSLRRSSFVLCSSRSASQGVKPPDVLISDCLHSILLMRRYWSTTIGFRPQPFALLPICRSLLALWTFVLPPESVF